MAEHSAIEWTDATWNPTTGCTKVSPACANCYIERTLPFRVRGRKFIKGDIPVELHPGRLNAPLKRRKPTMYFVNSLSDLFHADIPEEFIERVFDTMALTPRHTFQVLTKRPERMRQLVETFASKHTAPDGSGWPLPNVWLGVSVENQHFADERIPLLLETPAAVRFISAEPLLGPVDLRDWPKMFRNDHVLDPTGIAYNSLDWVIVGGESGPRLRPTDPAWIRLLRDQCVAAGVPFFFKQWGGRTAKSGGRLLDGREWNEMPARAPGESED